MYVHNYSNYISHTKQGSTSEDRRFCLQIAFVYISQLRPRLTLCSSNSLTVLLQTLHFLFHNKSTMIASMHPFSFVWLFSKSHSSQY